MSWTRFDDGWTDQQILADLSFETRWHYVCLIQFCSRTKRFDGFIRAVDARRCSDVSDPEASMRQLVDVGLVVPDQGDYLVHRMEEDHAPPPWVRNRTEQNKLAQRRKRAHDAGDHSLCLAENCELASPAEADTSADTSADRQHDTPKADKAADSHADEAADRRTGQDRPLTQVPQALSENSEIETTADSHADGDPWADDEPVPGSGYSVDDPAAPWNSPWLETVSE